MQQEESQNLLPEMDHGDQHGMSAPSSSRHFQHSGHSVIIRTKYSLEVDGVEHPLHATIGEDGRAVIHALPYKAYASIVDLVRDLIDGYASDFPDRPKGKSNA